MARIRMRLAGLGLVVVVASGCARQKVALAKELDSTRTQLLEVQGELAAKDEDREKLSDELAATQREVQKIEHNRLVLSEELEVQRAALVELEVDRERELEVINQLANALQALLDEEIVELVPRRGQMMVELQESVLFPSGQSKLTPSGRQTLDQVTQALLSLPDRRFMVAGHIDDVPPGAARYRGKLELSSKRASSVVDYMVKRGFPRQRLSATSLQGFFPLESNATPEGRAKNRRIEIILMGTWGSPSRPPPCRELDATDD